MTGELGPTRPGAFASLGVSRSKNRSPERDFKFSSVQWKVHFFMAGAPKARKHGYAKKAALVPMTKYDIAFCLCSKGGPEAAAGLARTRGSRVDDNKCRLSVVLCLSPRCRRMVTIPAS